MDCQHCKGQTEIRNWSKLKPDILVKIFASLSLLDLISSISEVCSSWRAACYHRKLWHTIDLTEITVPVVNPQELYACQDNRPSWRLMRALDRALTFGKDNVTSLIFHFYAFVRNDHLLFTAGRCPNLKQLVLPAWNQITEDGFQQAIRKLPLLESLTLPSDNFPLDLLRTIGANCPKLTELKVMTSYDHNFANTLFIYLPQLEVLSLRCTMVHKDDLRITLMLFDDLKVLNLTHSILVDLHQNECSTRLSWENDSSILEKASRLEKFLLCEEEPCLRCVRMYKDGGGLKWHEYEDGIWLEDEVGSLNI